LVFRVKSGGEHFLDFADDGCGLEGFDHVVLRAGFERVDNAALFRFRRHHDNGHGFSIGADGADGIDPEHVGHVPIHQHEIVLFGVRRRDGLLAIGGLIHIRDARASQGSDQHFAHYR
jgi:hypothetical protein